MKTYPPASGLTIRQRVEQILAHRRPDAKDKYVSVHNNADGDGTVFGFYFSDWDSPFADFKQYKELDYRLDTELDSGGYISLGFSPRRLEASV